MKEEKPMVRLSSLVAPLLALAVAGGLAIGQEPSAPTPEVPSLVTSPLPFIGVTPCRIVDTRDAGRPPEYGPPSLAPGLPGRTFTLVGQCGIPAGARAVSLNVTAVAARGLGYLLLYPAGGSPPPVSTLNYLTSQTVANAAIVPLGAGGGITVAAAVSAVDLLVDINGYFGATATDGSNTFLGLTSGNTAMTGLYNTGFGFISLSANTTGQNNTAAGYGALRNNTEGADNTAIGTSALYYNTTGSRNTAVGEGALASNTTGSDNVAVGAHALAGNSTGSYNTAVGYQALASSTGNSNIALGAYAGSALTSGDNNIYLGSTGAPSESNTIRIGDPGLHTRLFLSGVYGWSTILPPVQLYVDSTGKVGTLVSSARYKEDIRDMGSSSDGLAKLRPVTFRYRHDVEKRRQYGLIAEEVEKVFPELVVEDSEGSAMSVLYHELPAMLLNEWQKQQNELERQEAESRDLEGQMAREEEAAQARRARIEALASRLARLESEHGGSERLASTRASARRPAAAQ
jgi:hypothetical protein